MSRRGLLGVRKTWTPVPVTNNYDTPGVTVEWTCPAMVNSIDLELVGLGGAGDGGTNLGPGGGGGRGADRVRNTTLVVTPGVVYELVIPARNVGGTYNTTAQAPDGAEIIFREKISGTVLMSAAGGAGALQRAGATTTVGTSTGGTITNGSQGSTSTNVVGSSGGVGGNSASGAAGGAAGITAAPTGGDGADRGAGGGGGRGNNASGSGGRGGAAGATMSYTDYV